MQPITNYLGQFSLDTYSVRLNQKHGELCCDICCLKTVNDPVVGVFVVISSGDANINLHPSSINACVFCTQALTLSPDCIAEGVLYLIPELDQASLIRIVVAANCFIFAGKTSSANTPSKARQRQVQHRARCVKAARNFLDTLSRLGRERTNTVSRQSIRSQDLVNQLLNLESGKPRAMALKNAAKTLRFIPIMSAKNMPIFSFLSNSQWGLPGSFTRCIAAFEDVERKLAQRGFQNPPS